MGAKRKEIQGIKFGCLEAVSFAGTIPNKGAIWNCVCDCGKKITTTAGRLLSGNTKSCGCQRSKMIGDATKTHGMSKTKIYNTWSKMRSRCENTNDHKYPSYGGRGIRVCERWKSFDAFYSDMGDPPAGKTLNRKNNDGNYSPENCEWATSKEQSRNTRRNKVVDWGGSRVCLSALAERFGVNYKNLHQRLSRGWGIHEALLAG